MACKRWRGGERSVRAEAVHLLLNGHDLLAAAALGLDDLRLQNGHEGKVVALVQNVEQLLNHVVAVAVPNKSAQHPFAVATVGAKDYIEHLSAPGIRGIRQALLDHVARELVLAVPFEPFDDKVEHLLLVLLLSMLDNMLDHVIAKTIADQARHAFLKLSEDSTSGRQLTVLEAALDHAAAI